MVVGISQNTPNFPVEKIFEFQVDSRKKIIATVAFCLSLFFYDVSHI